MRIYLTSLITKEIKSQPRWDVISPRLELLLSEGKASNSLSKLISKLITAIMENNKDIPQKAKNRTTKSL